MWLAEPMWIAPDMDAMIDVISGFQEEMPSPLAEVEMGLENFPEREEARKLLGEIRTERT